MYKTLMSPSKYIAQYTERMQALMKARPGLREYHNGSIAAKIGLSFDHLRNHDPSAAAFLLLCGYLDNSAISFPLFHASARSREFLDDDDPKVLFKDLLIAGLSEAWLDHICEQENAYLDVVGSLHEFSFVRQTLETNDVISIHPLIHQWSMEYARSLGGLKCLMAAVAGMLASAVPRTYTHSSGLPYEQLQPHYDRWHSLLREDNSLASVVSCKANWELIRFRLSQAAIDENISLLRIAAANALARHDWPHHHTIVLHLPLVRTYRLSARTLQEGVDLLEKLTPHALKIGFLPEMSAEDDQAMVESVILYQRLLLCELAGPNDVLPIHGPPEDRNLVSSVVRRVEEIADRSRGLYVYPYLRWLRFALKRQRLGNNKLVVSDEDVACTQRVLDMLEHEILGCHPFAPPPHAIHFYKATLLSRQGESAVARDSSAGWRRTHYHTR